MKFITIFTAMILLATVGCQKVEVLHPAATTGDEEFLSSLFSNDNKEGSYKARPRPQSWADCELFDGVVTPATFKPGSGNFDELYMGGNGFKDDKPLISESKPGDQDYNGGRWHLNTLKSTVDPDKYQNACKVEDLDLNDFDSTTNYFECPLLPRRGNND